MSLRHLTWRGRASVVYYALRRLAVRPAPDRDRCVMGSPIGPDVWCPRRAEGDALWCRHHQREAVPCREWSLWDAYKARMADGEDTQTAAWNVVLDWLGALIKGDG